jgi:CheY-like chemotaxis protein
VPLAPPRTNRRQSIAFTDDEEYGAIAAHVLASAGYEPRTCSDGDTAFETVGEALPDLVVLDLDMIGRKSGWTVLDLLTLSPDTAHIPVVGLTRDVEAAHRDRAWLRDYAIVLLHKPFGAEDLRAAVEVSDLGTTDAGVSGWFREYHL